MKVEAFITVEYTGKNGRKYKRTKKAHSFVRSLIDLLYVQISYSTFAGCLDITNTTRSFGPVIIQFAMNAVLGGIDRGIRVGTGANAVAVTDYTLQTPIAHGTGSGQLSHGAEAFSEPTTVGSDRKFTTSRTFTNNSGANITVNEVAMYCQGGVSWTFCLDRTLNTFTINNGTSATVTYTIKVTV